MEIKGYINSIQTLGAVDGPGVRFVVFMQGCPLRCACCHNPDTWEFGTGQEVTPAEIVEKAERYREYFGEKGGITLSGGEPIMQPLFAAELFRLCKEKGINTCLDTSGCLLNDQIKMVLDYCDLVLLDVKYTNDADYLKYVGCSINAPLEFLEELDKRGIPLWLRQVIIPTLNDSKENVKRLKKIAKGKKSVEKIELLPFKNLCETKYNNLNIRFPLKDIPLPTREKMEQLNKEL